MKITAIKQQIKNPERVSVFVDSKYSFSLSLDELLAERLKKDIDIDESRLKALQKLSVDGKLHLRVLNWLLIRPHSTKEFRDYLRQKKVDPDQLEGLEADFTKRGYLNDENFAKWFIQQRQAKHKSNRAIISELRAKGIEQAVVQKITVEGGEVMNVSTNQKALKAILNKLSMRPRYQDKDKLIRYLISKGFNYSDIKSALDEDQ